MIRLQKITLAMILCILSIATQAQTDPYNAVYASNYSASETAKIAEARIKTAEKFVQQTYVSESFLNPNDGFIGIVFSQEVTQPNIYYKIVDDNGTEIYNGSAHANLGSQPTLYYNTQNLPTGKYRIFIENANFFMSTSFTK